VTAPTLDAALLDPGIRDLVVALHAAGWRTTDSGDGRSKPPEQRAMDFRHVAVATEPEDMLADADRLQAWLVQRGEAMEVEATYWPAGRCAILLAREVDDEP
jgi:hypothetical protein